MWLETRFREMPRVRPLSTKSNHPVLFVLRQNCLFLVAPEAEQVLLESRARINRNMGITQVTVAVSNPANKEKRWESLFLVDTGAVDCLVPRSALLGLGIEPESQRTYELADGSEIKMDIAGGRFEFMGEIVYGTVIFGADDAEPILGVTALESVGIEVDPRNQRLKRLPSTRLKTMTPKTQLEQH